ncbi:hypothetical protein G7Y89_g5908 [Cudoniella acicularis]|uniref:Uncharacterized protein n=1 Tax=Cudoniella acicularis TaxID=354080 RepID=A0A8H4RLL8_9HELO|nr:hypothetical protein G7Y89_g5908 [Cudoniella acicularis]
MHSPTVDDARRLLTWIVTSDASAPLCNAPANDLISRPSHSRHGSIASTLTASSGASDETELQDWNYSQPAKADTRRRRRSTEGEQDEVLRKKRETRHRRAQEDFNDIAFRISHNTFNIWTYLPLRSQLPWDECFQRPIRSGSIAEVTTAFGTQTMSTAAQQLKIRRIVWTGAIASITAMGTWYGAGLKMETEKKQVIQKAIEATPTEKIARLEEQRGELIAKRIGLENKIRQLDMRANGATREEILLEHQAQVEKRGGSDSWLGCRCQTMEMGTRLNTSTLPHYHPEYWDHALAVSLRITTKA